MTMLKKTVIGLLTASIMTASLGAYASNHQATEMTAFQQSSVTATDAIKTATAKFANSYASEIDFKDKNGQLYYSVEVIADNQKNKVNVDAKTGQILTSKVEKESDKEKKDEVKPKTAITLEQAIATVEIQSKGKVKEADLKTKNGQSYYKVETLVGSKLETTKVDATSGKIITE